MKQLCFQKVLTVNKNIFLKFVSVTLCSILVTGCGTNPVFDLPPDDGMALLYIYRAEQVLGSAYPSRFSINNQLLGSSERSGGLFNYQSGYFKVALKPGRHSLQTARTAPFIVDISPGHTDFVRYTYNIGFEQVSAAEAKREISGFEQLKGNYSAMLDTYVSPENIAWQSCRGGNEIGDCESFLDKFGRSRYASQAQQKIDQLKQAQLENELDAKFERDKQLPVAIRKDKYMVALTNHLKNERYPEAIQYFVWLERLNTKLASSFNYFYGEALLKTGHPEQAIARFYRYIEEVGTKGKYYKKALELVNEAETM